jgi:hypothetical protein
MMKKGFTQCIIGALCILMFTQEALATTPDPDQSQPSGEWQLLHNEDGSSEFAIQHGSVRHHYRLRLLALKVGEQTIELTDPKAINNQHYHIKQWLPYLKETWFQTSQGWQWVVEIDQPQDIDSTGQPIELSYQVSGDAQGGIIVSGSTSLKFDTNAIGEALRSKEAHDFQPLGEVFIGTSLNDSCYQTSTISPFPGEVITQRWEPGEDPFPFVLKHGFNPDKNANQGFSRESEAWYEASLQRTPEGVQLMIPTSRYIDGQEVEAIKLMHFSGFDQPGDVVMQSEVLNKPAELIDLLLHKGYWHPIKSFDLHRSVRKFRADQPKQFISAIQLALSGVSGLARKIDTGMAITLVKNQMMVVTSLSRNDEIHVFRFKNNQWLPQQVIEVPNFLNFEDGSSADLEVLAPVMNGDLMVIPVELYGSSVPFGQAPITHSLGVTWVYRKIRNSWLPEDTLFPKTGDEDDRYGFNLAVGRNQIIASAHTFGEDYNDSLPGLVHVFDYRQGRWQPSQVLRPPESAQRKHAYFSEGFGSQFKLVGDDLYILAKDEGFSSVPGISHSCPYFDSSGVVYHYQHIRGQWRLKQTITTTGHPGHVMLMTADEQGLYLLVSEFLPVSGTHQMVLYGHKGEQLRKLTAWATDHD